jgi:hypothetical protein
MMKLFGIYDALVVSDETDRTLSGAVRVSIIGITDSLEDDIQPLALPAVDSKMGVPTKGTFLKVYFEDGDLHQPTYLQSSPQKSYLPQEYIENYPNVAVANLGSDFFQMVHNRADKRTVIEHDSSSRIVWNAFGTVTHESDKGYDNTGYGAKQGNGKKVQRVLTEGSIDVFTCTPFSGGSEYLEVTHISKSSVTGSVDKQQALASPTPVSDENNGLDAPVTRPLLTEEIEYVQSKNSLTIQNRKVKIILVGNTGNNDFSDSVNSLFNSKLSAHYVVGRLQKDFIQMIDLDKAGTFGSKGTWNMETNLNKICISVLLCGDGKGEYSSDQYINLNKIILNAREKFGDDIEVVTISEVDPLMASMFGTNFQKGRTVA